MVFFAISLIGIGVSTDLTNIESIFPQDEDINVEGNLDMNSNNIQSFFSSGCSSEEVMVGINDDGSYDCVDVSDEVSSDYVDREGDSMSGALDMQENRIRDVDQISFEVDSNDFFSIDDGSDGDNTSPFTMRFDDRDWRLWAGGDDGASTVFVIDHDTGEVDFNHDVLVQGDIEVSGDVTGSSIIGSDQISSDSISVSELDQSDVDGRYLERSGDSMNGNLDMRGNDIQDIDELSADEGEFSDSFQVPVGEDAW